MKSLLLFLFLPSFACASNPIKIADPEDPQFFVEIQKYGKESQGSLAVVFPPTGGSTSLDRGYAKALAKRGLETWVIEGWKGFDEISTDPELHDRHITLAKRAFRLLQNKAKRDSYRLLGTSVGGMYVAAIAAEEDRVDAWVVIASGAPFSRVLAQSDQSDTIKVRDARKREWKFQTADEYEAILGGAISQDILPPRFPVREIDGTKGGPSQGVRWKQKKILFVIATEDTAVPTESQWSLWEAAGKPSKIEISSNHVWGIIRAYWSYGNEIADFLASP
jgi:pimeloyl-ACP methyl ester carboxylesterase